MYKCKITVLKRYYDEELAKAYGADSSYGKCRAFEEGQVFYTNKLGGKPEGFCEGAWRAIYHFTFALAHGTQEFFDGNWVNFPGAICCCNDGLRPVIFKVERAEDEPVA